MKIRETIKEYSKLLRDVTHIPAKEVEILILHLLEKNVIWLHLNYDSEFNRCKELEVLVKKRAKNYPLEYLTKRVSFYGESFEICENVLIPRPETELLIDKCLEILENIEKPKIIEVGTGSGIISVMLAKLVKDAEIIAVDINDDAIALAKKNAKKHQVEDKIKFVKSDIFDLVESTGFDLCVSNPPYIANSYKLPENVKFEPHNALFGGEVGDEILLNIINQSIQKRVNYLCCEMGYDQKKSLSLYLDSLGQKDYKFYKDYSEFDRGFVLKIKNN